MNQKRHVVLKSVKDKKTPLYKRIIPTIANAIEMRRSSLVSPLIYSVEMNAERMTRINHALFDLETRMMRDKHMGVETDAVNQHAEMTKTAMEYMSVIHRDAHECAMLATLNLSLGARDTLESAAIRAKETLTWLAKDLLRDGINKELQSQVVAAAVELHKVSSQLVPPSRSPSALSI